MLYKAKQDAIKKEALSLLKKDKPTKRELSWFIKKSAKYSDTGDIWIT